MVDSVEKTGRETIKAWIESIGLAPTPTVVQVEEPKPPAKQTLPTFEVQFGAETWGVQYRKQVGSVGDRALLDYGELSAAAAFTWRCGSEEHAEAFREQFRSSFLLACERDGKLADTPVLQLDATFFGFHPGRVYVYLEDGENLIFPSRRETGIVDYWVLTHSMMVTLPLLVLEPLPGTGFMDVLINAGQPDIDPFDMNDYGGP